MNAVTVQPTAPAIVAANLTRSLGGVPVLRGVTLQVEWGERVAIFGPNGAGKTTLLRVLATLLRPHGGRLTIAGQDVARGAAVVRRLLGVVAHQPYLYDDLTAEENLLFYGRMYDVPALAARIDAVLDCLELERWRHARVRTLSRGLQQRLALARAILHDPPILLLDEPDTGLDPHAFELLRQAVIDERRTVVLATHQLERGRQLCERAVVLVGGRIVDDGPAERLNADRLARIFV